MRSRLENFQFASLVFKCFLLLTVCNTVVMKAWNTQTSTDLSLDGPVGQVYALVVANGMLFAGVQVLTCFLH